MNFTKELVIKHSNIRVSLVNGSEKVVVPCLKFFLEGAFPYFQNLLESFPNETDITLDVINIPIAEHLLLAHHNVKVPRIKSTEDKLYMIHTKTYLNMAINNREFDLRVNEEHINLMYLVFLGCDLINNQRLLHILHRNLPKTYDISTFDSQIVAKLNKTHKLFAVQSSHYFNTIYLDSGIVKDIDYISCVYSRNWYSSPSNNLVAYCDMEKIKVMDLVHNKLKFEIDHPYWKHDDDSEDSCEGVVALMISPNAKYISVINRGRSIITVWDMENSKKIEYVGNYISFSPDEKWVVIRRKELLLKSLSNHREDIKIITKSNIYVFANKRQSLLLAKSITSVSIHIMEVNIDTNERRKINKLPSYGDSYDSCILSSDDKLIAFRSREYIRVYNLDTSSMIKEYMAHCDYICKLFIFSDDDKRVIFSYHDELCFVDIYDGNA